MYRPHYPYKRMHSIINHPYLHYPMMFRELPAVNPNQLIHSAQDSLSLLKDCETILTRISHSKEFSSQLMSAAQASQNQTVIQLIQSLGIKNMPKISYNPDGITFNFDHKNQPPHCCYFSIQLKWIEK
ncbi:hypothetical protein [Niallia sp. 01092]|uniref:hypothetical protein n=1 Tax=unclassified Niallia TaxID=2837522 RepID=UPI003FD41EDA